MSSRRKHAAIRKAEAAKLAAQSDLALAGFARDAYHAIGKHLADRNSAILSAVQRALSAWDTTTLPRANDGMLQEAMEILRAEFDKQVSAKKPHSPVG